MTTTPASTTPVWSAAIARLRSVGEWNDQNTARLLHAVAVTVATAVAVLAMVTAVTSLYSFAVGHEAGQANAIILTVAVLGLYTIITASAWRARLHNRRLSRLPWALWWITVAVGLAITAAEGSHTWVARGINAVPVAALAALTGLVTRPQQP